MADFDDEFVRRLREGDRLAEEVYFKHFTYVLAGKLYRHGIARAEADDIIQETLIRGLKVVCSPGGVRGTLPALMHGICENVVHEWRRAENRTESYDDKPFDVASRDLSALHKLLSDEDVNVVREVLAEMSHRDAYLIKAIFIEERDKAEVCRELGIKRSYLPVLLFRAKSRFRELLMKRNSDRRH